MTTYEVIIEAPVSQVIEIDTPLASIEVTNTLAEIVIDYQPVYLVEILDPANSNLIEVGVPGIQGPKGDQGDVGPPGSAAVTASDTPPPSPIDGTLWLNTLTDEVMIYRDNQWDEFVMFEDVPYLQINGQYF